MRSLCMESESAFRDLVFVLLECNEDVSKLENRLQHFFGTTFGENMSSFQIENKSLEIYRSPLFRRFVVNYSPEIRSLKLLNYFNCQLNIEWCFFEYLTNLEELEITNLVAFLTSEEDCQPSTIPHCRKTLKILKLDTVDFTGDRAVDQKLFWFFNPLAHFPNLEYFRCPVIRYNEKQPKKSYFDEKSTIIKNMIKLLENTRKGACLKRLDLASVSIPSVSHIKKDVFQELVNICNLKNIKLLNVNSEICGGILNDKCITSVKTFCMDYRNLKSLNLPNLEKIEVDTCHLWPSTFSHNSNLKKASLNLMKASWPKLKAITLNLYSEVIVSEKQHKFEQETVEVFEVVKLLMNSKLRPKVQDLEITFGKEENGDRRNCVTSPKIITALAITKNFSNLISLSVIGWDTDDASFVCLWSGLPLLQVLHFEDCSTASDDAFIGKTSATGKPAFFKLKSLRKLVLNFTHMPKLTYRLFGEVLCFMNLKELVLRSDSILYPKDPLNCMINLGAVGPFAKQVDLLFLDLLGLQGVPQDRWKSIKKMFKDKSVGSSFVSSGTQSTSKW